MGDARAAIAELVFAYAERLDAGDFDGVGALFAQATYRTVLPDGSTAVLEGSPAVRGALEAMVVRHGDGTPRTAHVTTNLIITVDDDRSATCRSRFTVVHAAPGAAPLVVAVGRYHDRFVGVDGTWRFADRLIHMDLVGDLATHLAVNPLSG